MDLAHLGIKVEYKDIDKAIKKLNELEKAGESAQKSLGKISSKVRPVSGTDKLRREVKKTEKSIDTLTRKIKKSDSALKTWWKRFGEVGMGFTFIYQAVNLVTGAIHSLNQIILDGIKLSGELVSTQAKLSMWLSIGSQDAVSFQEGMKVSKQIVQALADASLTSTSTLKELATGLDEVSQAGVFVSKNIIPEFADLVDFTKMVAETTGSTTRQIRQEFQALMQGQVKTTNILIRTAQQLHILTDEDIKGLKAMQNRQEVIEKLSKTISSYWSKAKEIIISADVNTAFDKWYDSLTRLVTKATELTSEKQGTMNIFGATIYKHIQELNKELQNMRIENYENFFLGLNIALDKFLSLVKKAVKSLMSINISADSVNLKFKELENFITGVIDPFQMFYDVAKSLDDNLVSLTNTLDNMGIHLVSIHKVIGEAFIYKLFFGKWSTAAIIISLDKIFSYLSKLEGKSGNELLNLAHQSLEYGIIGTMLFGWKAGAIIAVLPTIPYIIDKLNSMQNKNTGNSNYTYRGTVDWNAKHPEQETQNIINRYKKAIEETNNLFKNLPNNTELEKYAQKVIKSISTPIEKLIREKTKLDKLVEAGKITHEQELEYLTKEAVSYFNLKSSVEEVMKVLSKTPITWRANLRMLKENEQAAEEFKKHLEELEKYAQQLEETADPLEKFITEFKKLKETQNLVGLTNQAFAEGLLQISKNIIDVTDKENKLRKAFRTHVEELKTLPIEEVIEKIKKYYSELGDKQKTWKDGAIDALSEYTKSASDVAKNTETVFTNAFNNLEDTLTRFVTTGKTSFSDLVNSILTDLARLTIRQTITAPLAAALSAGLQGGFRALFSGGTSSATASPTYSNLHLGNFKLPEYHFGSFATGGVFLNSSNLSAYRNSIVNKPTLFTFASGMGLMGEAGAEAIMPLTRTSSGDLGVKAEVAPVAVNIIDQRGSQAPPVEISEDNVDGQKQITVLIKSEFENMLAKGEFDRMFKQTYGLQRRAY